MVPIEHTATTVDYMWVSVYVTLNNNCICPDYQQSWVGYRHVSRPSTNMDTGCLNHYSQRHGSLSKLHILKDMVDKPAVGLMKHQKVSFPLQPSNPTIFSWDPFLKKGYGK